MARSQPYQPLLLRILHGVNLIVVLLAMVTAFWVYNIYDGRLIQLPLPNIPDMIGIHGTFGVLFLIVFPALALYSFHPGQKRLIQGDTINKLTAVGKPIWWYSLYRIINTVMLLAGTWALMTGRQMKEEWLPDGNLNETWYQLHLSAWLVLLGCLIIHVLMGLKIGGTPLIMSMFRRQYRPSDSPRLWRQKIQEFIKSRKETRQ
ncbi:cytochrome b/b6 domain-containing protein [Gloeothece verrucosa]|uniref:cytochrome b/b6 domain-containing protein n=1 Tax=Gloeothece verrucosa TaxID=2546359 RepID=UPI00017E1A22|nr:cytochrome b/b6 domain-containing protein [Gloeothece verrucosa]